MSLRRQSARGLQSRRVGPSTPAFSPLNVAGIQFWVRADTVLLDGSNNVQQATDLSGNGNHFTQGTAGSRPAWNSSDALFGGKPSIQVLSGKSIANTGFSLSQSLSLFVVGAISTDNTEIFSGATTRVDIGRSPTGFYMFAGTATVNTASRDSNGHAFGYIATSGSGGNSNLFVDSSASAAATGNPGSNALAGPTISGFAAPVTPSAVAEAICYTGAVSAGNIHAIFAYFGGRYSQSWT